MKHLITGVFIFISSLGISQKQYTTKKGQFELGVRNTYSLFSSNQSIGEGIGGQFRIGISEKINTEWFADYIVSNISNLGKRADMHLGWSVMFYPFEIESSFKPYILAGHCFDYTKINAFKSTYTNIITESQDRWSSAVQMGIGTHFALSKRTNLSLSAQYMMHLGTDLHAHTENVNGLDELVIETHAGAGIEGHLLLNISLNVTLANFTKKKENEAN